MISDVYMYVYIYILSNITYIFSGDKNIIFEVLEIILCSSSQILWQKIDKMSSHNSFYVVMKSTAKNVYLTSEKASQISKVFYLKLEYLLLHRIPNWILLQFVKDTLNVRNSHNLIHRDNINMGTTFLQLRWVDANHAF